MRSNYKIAGILGSFFILSLCFGLLIQAWTGPTSAPPGDNLPRPINVGSDDQEKAGRISATEFYDADDPDYYINPSGASKVSGSVSIGGNLVDLTNSKTIYDASTGQISPLVMPYKKGAITSDWASTEYTAGYYDVSNLSAGNVKNNTSYGRGNSGSLKVCGTIVGYKWKMLSSGEPGYERISSYEAYGTMSPACDADHIGITGYCNGWGQYHSYDCADEFMSPTAQWPTRVRYYGSYAYANKMVCVRVCSGEE